MRRQAFTLIELLVVISIIALLVAILLPALSASKKTAEQTDCANRMRQSTLAILLYVDDNKEVFPSQYGPHVNYAGERVGGQEYRAAIAQYTGMYDSMIGLADYYRKDLSKNPMLCKASDGFMIEPGPGYWSADTARIWSDWCVLGTNFFSCFQINPYFGTYDNYQYDVALGYRTGEHTRKGYPKLPSKTFALADGFREARPNYWYVADGRGMFRFRHFETGPRTQDGLMNMSYLDGHVRAWKYEVGGPIYPYAGDGLSTLQEGFYWWNNEFYN